jgi:deazaflavin-dependent oxidoreductase (nitroreductase family)
VTDRTLLEQLAFEVPENNAFRRSVRRAVSSRKATPLLARFLEDTDRILLRLTDGRSSVAGLLAGQPVITLTTTGAKTGQRRSTILNAWPLDGDLAVLGTNFGRSSHPGWVHNLAASPAAEVTYKRVMATVTAERMGEAATNALFEQAIAVHVGYAQYRASITDRDVRAFRLRPA